jgi:parallel beta-helix repeat protein
LTATDVNGPITLLADTFGFLGGPPGQVVITSRGGSAPGILLDGVSELAIDGFTVLGTTSGIELRDSSGITIFNNIIRNNQNDGLRMLRSAGVLVFNNLIYGNQRTGITVVGSIEIEMINNTIYGNQTQGIWIGDDLIFSESIFLRNNIIHMNRSFGILAHPATELYDGNYNLNTDGYGPDTPRGPNDLTRRPFFSNPGNQDGFRLPPTTDDCSGGDIAMDAGDPDTDPDLAFLLSELTTQTDNKPDCIGSGCCPPGCGAPGAASCARIGFVDLGFHYPIP